jgi:hypothetical protein
VAKDISAKACQRPSKVAMDFPSASIYALSTCISNIQGFQESSKIFKCLQPVNPSQTRQVTIKRWHMYIFGPTKRGRPSKALHGQSPAGAKHGTAQQSAAGRGPSKARQAAKPSKQRSPASSEAQQAAKHGATRRPTFLSGKWRVEVATPTFCRPAFCLQLGQILKPTHRHTNNLLPDPSTFHYGPAILILPIFCRPRS